MRLPPIHPSALDPVQKDLYDDMRAGIATGFNSFRTSLDDGSMIGPWNASLHHPTIGKAFWQLTKAISSFGTLPGNVKEVAILVVGGFYKTSYEIYAHVAVTEHMGMPPARSILTFSASLSTQMTVWPPSAKQVPVTRPT